MAGLTKRRGIGISPLDAVAVASKGSKNMGNVIAVPQWGRVANTNNVLEKFSSCDKFIRSRIEPPPLGSVTFHFDDGKVTMTGGVTTIHGDDCEIIIRNGVVNLRGSEEQAVDIFCSIHRAIEQFQMRASTF